MLSPSLVLLIIEGLSRLIDSKKVDGCLKGVKIASLIQFMHLLFVDDVMLFESRSVEERTIYKGILDLFCRAYGMLISESKSRFPVHDVDKNIMFHIVQGLPFQISALDLGILYLGYFIKPNNYSTMDRLWLLKQFDKKEKHKFHLVIWECLDRPKLLGGWALENIFLFTQALTIKRLWCFLFVDSLWSRVIKGKLPRGCLCFVVD